MNTAIRSGVSAADSTKVKGRCRAAAILAANVRRVRHERGMNQEQLAAACGWAQARISAIEAGKTDRKLATIESLSSALEISIESLLREPDVDDGEDDGEGDYGIFFDDDDDCGRGDRGHGHGHGDEDGEDDGDD